MKIAILTSGILPIPAVLGGAVENLIDFYLEYNEIHKLHDITVYSVYHPEAIKHPALSSKYNHYHYIDTSSPWARNKRKIYSYTYYKKEKCLNNYFIEYFFENAFQYIKKQKYDIILMENRPSYAYKIRKAINARLVCHLHNELLNVNSKGAKEIYNSLDKIITVSNYITNSVKTINQNDKKCITVYNGINLHAFCPNCTPSIKREEIGLSSKDFVLIYSGRINQEKGILELINAMNQLKEEMHIKLLVIGGSFFGNDKHENDFIKKLKEISFPIRERIIFTGFIPYEMIPEYLKISDVAVIPSIWNDPFPTTVLEAQAMGLPVIATKNGGIPEEVTNENAILLETDENFTNTLAHNIVWLYKHPKECEKMREISLIHSKKFNKERFAADFFNALIDS